MRFSIITITYNAEKFLKETLASVAGQQFVDFEHILWDGGGSDRTLEIASSFPHVKILQGKDHGIGDAMNRGAAHARGEFLLHLHADDCLAHVHVLREIDTFLKQHPQAEWIYGRAQIIDEKGTLRRETLFLPDASRRLKKYNCITHPSTVISRALFEKNGGFDVQWRYAMDYDLWLRLSACSRPIAYPGMIGKFREHALSLSTKEVAGVTDEAYAIRNRFVKTPWGRWKSYRTWKKRKKRCSC